MQFAVWFTLGSLVGPFLQCCHAEPAVPCCAVLLRSVVYSAFRAGSNTSTFSTGGSWHAEASRPLIGQGGGQDDEENLTSAGLDGLPPNDQSEWRIFVCVCGLGLGAVCGCEGGGVWCGDWRTARMAGEA